MNKQALSIALIKRVPEYKQELHRRLSETQEAYSWDFVLQESPTVDVLKAERQNNSLGGLIPDTSLEFEVKLTYLRAVVVLKFRTVGDFVFDWGGINSPSLAGHLEFEIIRIPPNVFNAPPSINQAFRPGIARINSLLDIRLPQVVTPIEAVGGDDEVDDLDLLHPPDPDTSRWIGDKRCIHNACSPYLRCAINPTGGTPQNPNGGCEVCPDYKCRPGMEEAVQKKQTGYQIAYNLVGLDSNASGAEFITAIQHRVDRAIAEQSALLFSKFLKRYRTLSWERFTQSRFKSSITLVQEDCDSCQLFHLTVRLDLGHSRTQVELVTVDFVTFCIGTIIITDSDTLGDDNLPVEVPSGDSIPIHLSKSKNG